MKEKEIRGSESQRGKKNRLKQKKAKRAFFGPRAKTTIQRGVAQIFAGEDRARENGDVHREVMRPEKRRVSVKQSDDQERGQRAAYRGCGQPSRQRAIDFPLERSQRERGPEGEFKVLPCAFIHGREHGDERNPPG